MKIAVFGDSISTHVEMEVMTQALLTEAGISAQVERFAVAGEDTNAAMNRLAGVVASSADYYYIFFGANDAAVHRQISPSQFADNLTTFVTAFGAGKTTILTPPYVNETAIAKTQKMLGRTNAGFVPYVEIAKQVASQTGAGLIELNQAMFASPNPDDLIVSDGVHFTTKGYQLITSLITADVTTREVKKSMSNQFQKMYYAENPDAAHDIHQLDTELLAQNVSFTTDAGVFSKKAIDFGSQVLLSAVNFEAKSTLLDVGCGYGPIGITLAKAQGVIPTMIDVNLRALALSEKNAEKNGVAATIFQSNLYDKVVGTYDNIISNPPIRAGKDVVHGVITGAFDHLSLAGTLTIVIQKKQGAPSAKAKMATVFGNCEVIKKEKGYFILQSIKEETI